MAASYASIQTGLRGPSTCTATACASGAHAIGEAFLHVATGMADAVVAGGAEAVLTPLAIASFARMNALSTRSQSPAEASRPFDLDRDGFVMGEGCGVIVLEEYDHARQRGAQMLAELVGYGVSADAHHITGPGPEGEGQARCMAAALRMARINPEDVDYVNAHGTSTKANDTVESVALETVFGDWARKLSVSSTKGVTGHCLGAAGGIEAAYTILAVYHGVVPPTINYTTPDPTCRLDYTPNVARQRRIRHALSNSFAFGGQNACLVFQHLDHATRETR
jgi:3-oxoacyl-[acyl-carrier-protein] synthase II